MSDTDKLFTTNQFKIPLENLTRVKWQFVCSSRYCLRFRNFKEDTLISLEDTGTPDILVSAILYTITYSQHCWARTIVRTFRMVYALMAPVMNHRSRYVTNLERTDDEHTYKLYSILNTVYKPTIIYMTMVLNFQLPNKLNAYINTSLNSLAKK